MNMNILLRSEEVEQVFPPSLPPEQSRLTIGPCDSLGLEPPLRRGEAQWIAAEVLLMVARRAVYGVAHSISKCNDLVQKWESGQASHSLFLPGKGLT